MDAGVIAMLKAMLRNMYAAWAMGLVTTFIEAGNDPATFELPLGKQSATQNIAHWLVEALPLLAAKKERIVHCWDKTGLLGAWLRANGVEAVQRAAELFPNLAADRRGVDDAPEEDPEPDTDVGAPIDEPDDVPVLRPDGSMLRGGAGDSEVAQLRAAEGWIDFSDGRTANHSSHSEGGHCPLSLSGPAPAPTVHLSELGVPTPEWTFHSVELGRPALALE